MEGVTYFIKNLTNARMRELLHIINEYTSNAKGKLPDESDI